MIKKRNGFFETNSSSSHSLNFDPKCTEFWPYTGPAVIQVTGGEYGWGYEELCTDLEKINYMYTLLVNLGHDTRKFIGRDAPESTLLVLERFRRVIEDYTGAKLDLTTYDDSSYVDHQSLEHHDCLYDDELLKIVLFGKGSYIVIDNDNH